MQKENAAHFDLVKLHNRKLIRNILRTESKLGIAELSEKSHLSYPTVAALLKELVKSREVILNAEVESRGGRPGLRYELNAAYQYALIMYFKDWILQGTVYDASGKPIWKTSQNVSKETDVDDIESFVSEVKEKFPFLTVIVLGIPGVVYGTEIKYLPKFPNLEGTALSDRLKALYKATLFLENDMNAIALAEVETWRNFAHIAYVNNCIGVGIVLEGEVVKGYHGYAGELEYLCKDLNNPEITFAKCILTLVCVLDLPDILISGASCNIITIQTIKENLAQSLPEDRIPQIHVVEDMDSRYECGLLKRVLLKWEEDE